MGKSILILKKPPRNCATCPLSSFARVYCDITCSVLKDKVVEDCTKRPAWCPIKEIPQKKSEWNKDILEHESFDLGRHVGWNECIDMLLGKEE